MYSGSYFNPQPGQGSQGDLLVQIDNTGSISRFYELPISLTHFAVKDTDDELLGLNVNLSDSLMYRIEL